MAGVVAIACPRCGAAAEVRWYGPCDACRGALRAAVRGTARDVQTQAYEPAMHVTPNAVALKYDADKMHAPTVVAKGGDYMALRIRQLAREAGVPIVEKPPLARALYHGVEVGRAIAPEFYQAVAEILAYVYRLKGRAA